MAKRGHQPTHTPRVVLLTDSDVLRVVAALRRNGLERNTLVVFTADNGAAGGVHDRRRGGPHPRAPCNRPQATWASRV